MNAIEGDGQAVSRIAAGRVPTDRELGIRRPGPYPMGLMAILATVAMLFAAFTAALLVRRTGTDWTPVPLPLIVWWNTLALIASSAALEVARARVRREALEIYHSYKFEILIHLSHKQVLLALQRLSDLSKKMLTHLR